MEQQIRDAHGKLGGAASVSLGNGWLMPAAVATLFLATVYPELPAPSGQI